MNATNISRHGAQAFRRVLRRRGNIIVLAAFLMIAMMAFLALAIDVGYRYSVQTELQRAVDSAALAGVQDLVNGVDEAQSAATEYLVRNPVGSSMTFIDENQLASNLNTFKTQHAHDFQMKFGTWDPT